MPRVSGTATSKRLRILCIGDDPHLLNSRKLVLESVGYEVLSIGGLTHIGSESIESFHLVVLCHTVEERRSKLVNAIRRVRPEMPILQLNAIYSKQSNDGVEVIGPGPAILLEAIKRIVQRMNDNWETPPQPF